MSAEMAGSRLVNYFLTDPRGEEILEGVMGGGMAGLSQIGTGASPGEIALKTASAIAGGIGMGMLGRRIGAKIGARVHEQPLRDQQGMLAMIGRTTGSESTAAGLRDQGKMMKSAVQEGLMRETSSAMARQAAEDPIGFAKQYGITAEQMERMLPGVNAGRTVSTAAQMLRDMPEAQRKLVVNELMKEYEAVENAIAAKASGSIDELIREVANAKDIKDLKIPGSDRDVSSVLESLLTPTPPVTGEHIGRAAGRFIGDEVGVLGGLALGEVASRALGMEDPREQRIRELEKQLAGRKG